ncbi:MAG: 30S ribosomal protein S18 [Candidatus Pacebacteria bacterium]|jgi:small subunit ribosomal protein S18|nr:30S ribosomal protein S18 [Candidatus Paceibacterota bacterium]
MINEIIKPKEKKTCYFCSQAAKEIDYKDVEILKRFLSAAYKIKKRKHTGLCSFHQRKFARAVKRARQMALLPFLP